MNQEFDSYSAQARLFPAVLCVSPLAVSFTAWFPDTYKLAIGLLGSTGLLAATLLFTHMARSRGRKLEARLFSSWGGPPSTTWMQRADTNLDAHTKSRYRECLQRKVPGWKAPSEVEELADRAAADAKYASAARWLRESTRDTRKFPLIFKENVSFGFRRNLKGIKGIGIAVAVVCVVLNILGLFISQESFSVDDRVVAACFCIVCLAAWIVVVTDEWVRDAGEGYARALLAACDQMPE